ncbi:DEAD/DEAH box helicase [Candidatus Dojkabacteria bacterium]|uniref:DEAD/DEAH box helicase n=1 Tax=Candidatus Dojkabacteria bacterium TaxID=2099670 RepID=A0A955L357_9BACT|nr:DEAD/DEAH box helicase [Candidatus Dojkabacteria bacterium]
MDRNVNFYKVIQSGTSYKNVLRLLEKGEDVYITGVDSDFRIEFANLISNNIEKQVTTCDSGVNDAGKQGTVVTARSGRRFTHGSLLDDLFNRTHGAVSVNQYSVFGDRITFWSPAYDYPTRIELFGDTVESIRLIDPYSGRTVQKLEEVVITNSKSLKVYNYEKYSLVSGSIIHFISKTGEMPLEQSVNEFDYTSPQLFFGNNELFNTQLKHLSGEGYKIFIDFAYSHDTSVSLIQTDLKLASGIISKKEKFVLYTKREIYTNLRLKNRSSGITRNDDFYKDVEIDDYLVHEDHGIGIYQGLEKKKVLEKDEEYIILEYASNDKLYIPLSQLSKITKYEGAGKEPRLTRLNSREWIGVMKKVRKTISVIARDLMSIYAGRELVKGHNYNPDRIKEDLFASKFEFEMTVDQKRVIEEIFADMNSESHMDRLLVGDVGYGKTELAMRAAYRAVLNGKQVAVLVPTTVLASQHLAVFNSRFKDFGVKVEMISRFSAGAENKRRIAKLKTGEIDIMIGTHRLLSSDVEFKDLGLVVVDEEQRFGVKQKERLKNIRLSADVLSLSATPIPRSLYMSLIGLRDISILNTPPKGRKSVVTRSLPLDWKRVVTWVQKELDRGGQVYFVHNDIATIDSITEQMKAMMPSVRFVICHAQLPPKTLEKRINAFYEGEFDVLVTTTIIQNGIDVPNVNTIIINNSNRLGLGQLYQLRGRVGRSSQQAYCYLLYPKQRKVELDLEIENETDEKVLSKGMERIEAILEHQELGSGFNIASKDLEMRGAGSILGYSQSGSIEMVGLSLYLQVLTEEIERIKKLKSLTHK